jgi:uncharacterized ferritin-like protein (DUF455 family)
MLEALRLALAESDPEAKAAQAIAIAEALRSGELQVSAEAPIEDAPAAPGRPARPALVPVREVPRRGLGTPEGRAALLHAVAHIEFNAINLALDAAWRFRGMPREYYLDWTSVAADEARHFRLLRARLRELGHDYGDFAAHNGLWEMAEKSADRCLARMALVPRLLEARGLDVTPGMIERLRQLGDTRTVAILQVILREEVAHVAAGTRWYRHCCARDGLDPVDTFFALLQDYMGVSLRGPFNLPARRAAGFVEAELDRLLALATSGT